MRTVPNIEAPIEKLPPAELRELITWIEGYAELKENFGGKRVSQPRAVPTFAGDTLGALADLGGGIGAVTGLIDTFLSQNNKDLLDIKSRLQDIEDTIKQKFAQLNAEQRAEQILDRLRDLDPAIASAQPVYDELSAAVRAQPPVTEEFRLAQVGLCLDDCE
jgi:hypothetical protein